MSRDWRFQLVYGGAFWCLLALTFVIYAPGLKGPLLLDDYANLAPLQELEQYPDRWQEVVGSNKSGPLGRPISLLTFVANRLSSGASVEALKHTNLMLHLLSGAFVFWLAGRLLRERWAKPWLGALWVATLWLTAPLFVSTVLYVIQRMAQLSALFMLIGLLTYAIGRQNMSTRPILGSLLVISTFLLWTPIAAFSKENGALLPLLAFLTEYFVFRFSENQNVKRFLFALFGIALFIPAAIAMVYTVLHPEFLLGGYEGRPFTLTERLLTQTRVLVKYAVNLIAPQSMQLGIYHDDYPVSTGLFSPLSTAASLVILLTVLVAAFWLRRRRPFDLLAFGLLFYLGAHVLESSAFPLELYFEHRNYLPAVGLFLAVASLGFVVWQHFTKLRAGVLVVALAVPGLLAASTYNRVQVWGSEATLLSYAGTFHAKSVRANTHIALLYARDSQIDSALKFVQRLERLDATSEPGLLLLRFILYCQAQARPPAELYDSFRDGDGPASASEITENLKILTDLVVSGSCTTVDAERFTNGVDIWLHTESRLSGDEGRWKLYAFAAKLNGHIARYREALTYVKSAEKLSSNDPVLPMMRVYYLIKLGKREAAEQALTELRSLQETRHGSPHIRRTIEYYRKLLDTMAAPGKNA